MITSHGEDVESHSHNQETWNEVTPVKIDNTHGEGKSSDPILMLTGTPSTPHAATSYPPDMVEVLQKPFEELKEERARDKELFEQPKEENREQYEEKLKSHALTMKEELIKEANSKIAEMLAQYIQQLPISPPKHRIPSLNLFINFSILLKSAPSSGVHGLAQKISKSAFKGGVRSLKVYNEEDTDKIGVRGIDPDRVAADVK
ncbi:hypothetical protein Tco_0319362 [Tanacetum coccineum]